MPELQHPAFSDVTVTVEDDRVQEHVDAGWLRPQTKAARQLKAERESEQ